MWKSIQYSFNHLHCCRSVFSVPISNLLTCDVSVLQQCTVPFSPDPGIKLKYIGGHTLYIECLINPVYILLYCRGQTKQCLNSSQKHMGKCHWLSHNKNRKKTSEGKPWWLSSVTTTCHTVVVTSAGCSVPVSPSRAALPPQSVAAWVVNPHPRSSSGPPHSLSLSVPDSCRREWGREIERGCKVPSLLRKHRPPLLWSPRWRNPIFKGPQCSRTPNGKIEE